MASTKHCRVTEYVLQIKTGPDGWRVPYGWGPYYTAADAERARVYADKQGGWDVRVRPIVTDVALSADQIKDLRALGQVVAVL